MAIKEQTEHDFSDFVRSHLTPKSSVIIKLTEDQIFSQRYFTGTIPNQPKADAPIIPPEAYNNFITKYAGFINASLRLAKGLTVNQRQLFEAVIWELSKSGVAVNDDNFLHQKNALLHLIKEDPEASVDDLMNHFEGGNNSFKK